MNTVKNLWANQWSNSFFRKSIFLSGSILILIVIGFPVFFSFVQQRQGKLLMDPVLRMVPARDVSIWIFVVLYATIALAITRMVRSPEIFVRLSWAYIFLCMTRLLTISIVSLDPPEGLIDLVDPFTIIFYHAENITKDLFFSGHVSTLFLIGLCLPGKKDKMIAFSASAMMAILVLVQHIHYSLDVIAAPVFSILFWYMGVKVCSIVCKLHKCPSEH